MKKALALSALPILFLFVAAFQSPNSVPGQLTVIQSQISSLASQNSSLMSQIGSLEAQVAALAAKGPRQFYLTKTKHDGAHALSACAVGYHMANFWEIHEPTNLRYNTDLGVMHDDSGSGPPSFVFAEGWIRSGLKDVGPGPSQHCEFWSSADSLDFAVTAYLSFTAENDLWVVDRIPCNLQRPVWCVQD